SRNDTRPSDGHVTVLRRIEKLEDEAALGGVVLLARLRAANDRLVHAGTLQYIRCMTLSISPEAKAELAPGGKLRAGINHSNFLIVNPGSPHGAPEGVAPELARELARAAGVEVEFASFDAAGKLADAVKNAEVDVGFLGNEPQRADV